MKRIHIIQHVAYETPGCIENWIKEKNYNYTLTALFNGETLPEVNSIDWLVIMGGSMSVHDVKEFPWLADEKRFIKSAIAEGKIVIGICLGSQLIAEALGSSVYKNRETEIGWLRVEFSIGKGKTALLKNFLDSETVFQWHGDTFDIPDGSIHGAFSEACRNQCFVYSEKVLGLQFHLEVTEVLLDGMMENGADELVPGNYIQNADQIKSGKSNIERNNELMYSILDEFDKL